MITDANLVGGGDNANPNQTNGSSIEQTVNSSPSTVEATDQKDYGVPGLVKFFNKYPSLTDLHKKMLAGLYADGESMRVVKKAAQLLLGSEEYDANADKPHAGGFSVKELWAIQDTYSLDESDMDMLFSLFESGCSSEVIIGKAKRLANLEEANTDTEALRLTVPNDVRLPHGELTDEDFVNWLTGTYELCPEDFCTIAGMMQRGIPRDLVERTAKRFGEYPPEKRVISHTIPVSPAPSNRAIADTSFALEISANGRVRWSQAQVLTFALTQYIESRHDELLANLSSEDFGDAMNSQHDIDAARELLCGLALGLAGLANNNYWANKGESTEGDAAAEFRSFAKNRLKWAPTETDLYVKENY